MSVIVNDFSVDEQFNSMEELLDSLNNSTIPAMKVLEMLKIDILKSYNTYSLKITKDKTLGELLRIRSYPEITKFKSQLVNLCFEEPYWEDNSKSNNSSVYECKYTENKNDYCIAEALERKIPLISFEHNDFKESVINIKRNGQSCDICNFYNKDVLLEILRELRKIDGKDYFLFKYNMEESFGRTIGKDYFNELIKCASLNNEDIDIIVNDMERLILNIKNGQDPRRLTGPIEGKLKEFRTSLRDKREIRVFYFQHNGKTVFLNGFLKKTEQTPDNEIEKAKILMAKINN